jgi:hypothetical protein
MLSFRYNYNIIIYKYLEERTQNNEFTICVTAKLQTSVIAVICLSCVRSQNLRIYMKFTTKNISHCFTYMSGISPYAKHWEKFEDIKGIIIIRKSNRDIQRNGHKKKDKKTNNDLKITTTNSCTTSGTRCVTIVTNLVIHHEWWNYGIVITTNDTYVKMQ